MRMHEVATAGQPTITCRKPHFPSHLAVGDLARRFGLGAEMIGSVLSERVASGAIRGRMEAGVVHTPAYLARIKAQLRWGNNGLAAGGPGVEGACSGCSRCVACTERRRRAPACCHACRYLRGAQPHCGPAPRPLASRPCLQGRTAWRCVPRVDSRAGQGAWH